MEHLTTVVLAFFGLLVLAGFGYFALVSLAEGQGRAAWISFTLALVGSAVFLGAVALPPTARLVAVALVALVGIAIIVLFFLPAGRADHGNDEPSRRHDERDVMFARARLEPGSPEFEAYYAMRPENRTEDDMTRSRPGLLSPQARLADPMLFASAQGSFTLTEVLREAADGPVAGEKHLLEPDRMTAFLKGLARYHGALEVGVAEVKPYHVYSHVGRGTGAYGEAIPVEHGFALAFTVEMDHRMLGASPGPAGLMESARQYVEAARIAVPLAAAVRRLGYPARAHIDGNYRVIAPLVARDAGLGEIGRMGLLMTPGLGPRVRLGVVTTSAVLVPDGRTRDASVLDFCTLCNKCAENCPSKSIPTGPRREIDGVLRWRINADTCFRYWNVVGTDCGLCLDVCPYSHPDNLAHNLVRWGITRSGYFRRAAIRLDDVFYGGHPARRRAPEWLRP